MRCPGSLALEADYPNTSSKFSAEGTAAHELASWCLDQKLDADAFLGRVIEVDGYSFEVDTDMASHVQTYVDTVREYVNGVQGELMVEQKVDFSARVDVPESFGTSDAIIISSCGRELQVHDLKYGRGVKVDAEWNEQLMLYALGAYDAFGLAYDFTCYRVVIHQPRLNHVSEWGGKIEELVEFGETAKADAAVALANCYLLETTSDAGQLLLTPGEKQCRFCKAKADCPALMADVTKALTDGLEDLTEEAAKGAIDKLQFRFGASLGGKMAVVGLVEDWCKAVRARAESELLAGRKVDGFKLGRRQTRQPRTGRTRPRPKRSFKAMRLKAEEIVRLLPDLADHGRETVEGWHDRPSPMAEGSGPLPPTRRQAIGGACQRPPTGDQTRPTTYKTSPPRTSKTNWHKEPTP